MSVTMDNQEDILDALRDFEKKPPLEIPPVLEQYLGRVASTGETIFPWSSMKPLFVKKLDEVMQQFETETHMDSLPLSPNVENVKFDAMRTRILEAIDRFHGAPFTIQRLCELITDPKKHYKRADKFLRGVEKNILVVSTVDPFGRKIVSESKTLVNGMDSNGHTQLAEKSGQVQRICPKSGIAPAPEPNWLSNEITSSIATPVPMKDFIQSHPDADSELAAEKDNKMDKNIEPSSEREEDHSSVKMSGDPQRDVTESSTQPAVCPSSPVSSDANKWLNADSTQPCANDNGSSSVLPDSQDVPEKSSVAQSANEEKISDSDSQIHSDEASSHPFLNLPGSTEAEGQTSLHSISKKLEPSDHQTEVSSTEEDPKPVNDVEKDEKPSSSREGDQAFSHSFEGRNTTVAASGGGDASTPMETPEEGISSSESSGTPSPPGECQAHAEKDVVSASVPHALPDSPAVSSESQECSKAKSPDSESLQIDPAVSPSLTKENEAEVGRCDTTDDPSSSSENLGVAMETEDSSECALRSTSHEDSNSPATSSSSVNPAPQDEAMDQD